MEFVLAKQQLPLGNVLLDKTSPDYETKLQRLNIIQEILDDFILEEKYSCVVSTKLAVIYTKEETDGSKGSIPKVVEDFVALAKDFFEVFLLDLNTLENFSGGFGNFRASLNDASVVEFSQAVLFAFEEELLRFRGVYSVADFKNAESLLETLRKNIGEYRYKEIISYKEDACQYHHRREKYCTKCVGVCPTFGVGSNDNLMELMFSPIDCIACGACVGVCPTNCLEYEELPKEALDEIIDCYKNQKIFLCSNKDYYTLLEQKVQLPDSLMPMVLPNLAMLNENDLLNMVQTSGHAILVYDEALSAQMEFLNNITRQIYNKDSVLLAINAESLSQEIPTFETYLYKNRYNKPFRESFAQRLQFMVKENNYGLARSITEGNGAPVFYGDLHINAESCTLCLSCVGACNVNALFARSDDFSLRFNPSLCTTCGYCVTSCPENVIELTRGGMTLESNYFKSREMAKDKPFLCVECGKPFSTQKSIDKVVGMLSVAFSNDPKKLRTLQCCADCKVKVMFG